MRILVLEHPRTPSEHRFNEIANTPLWSCLMAGYAASALAHVGFDVEILDARLLTSEATVESVLRSGSELLAIHGVYFWEHTGELFDLIAEMRTRGFEGTVCLFGFFPTLTWQDILRDVSAVDGVVVGEPETTLVELAQGLASGRVPSGLPGLAVRRDGMPTLTVHRPAGDSLDELPFPLRPGVERETTVSVLASRGCYNGCSFCLIPTLDGGRTFWRSRSPANVIAELESLKSLGKKSFYFVDPNFIGPGKPGRDQALRLADALCGLGIAFGMETRAADLSRPLMTRLVDAGLSSLLLGIESGSASVLRRLAKHTRVADNAKAIAIVRDVGLEPEIGFIMFEPESTMEDVQANLRFLEENRLLDRLGRTANLLYHEQIAFKGTPGYRIARAQGRLSPEGVFGFEGRLHYVDPRVGWLAEVMRAVCRFVLREMAHEGSTIHWSREDSSEKAYTAVNDCLVEIFRRTARFASGLSSFPSPARTEAIVTRAVEAIRETFNTTDAPPKAGRP